MNDQAETPNLQMCVFDYGQTKLIVERMLEFYRSQYGLGYGILRYFNAAGADEKGRAGEIHDPETHLIPVAIRAAVTGQEMEVFGDDYPTHDGTCIRDYIHVSDLAEAHVRTADRITPGNGLIYNLGTGRGYSVREVIEEVQKVILL